MRRIAFGAGLLGLLAALLLPGLAGAETWADFVGRAKEAQKSMGDEIVVEAEEPVACFRYDENAKTFDIEPLDKALTVTDGKTLVIRGGTFEGMLLGRGSYVLEGVTVTAGTNDVPAIWLDSVDAGQHIQLRVDDGSRVTAAKKGVSAISNRLAPLRDIRSFPVTVRIENQGVLEVAGKSPAIDLNYTNNGTDAIDVEVVNTGEMRAHVSLYAKGEDQVALRLKNRDQGSIDGASGSVLDATSYWGVTLLEFENGPEAVIRSENPPAQGKDSAAAVSLRANWHEESWFLAENLCVIRNEGEIYGHNALMLGGVLSLLNNLEYEDAGRGKTEDAYLSLEFTVPHVRGMDDLTQRDFESGALGWLLMQELPDLPPLLMVRATVGVDYYEDDEIWQTTYPLEPVEFYWGIIEANRREGTQI